jgi:hypothetical protein
VAIRSPSLLPPASELATAKGERILTPVCGPMSLSYQAELDKASSRAKASPQETTFNRHLGTLNERIEKSA